MQVVAPERKPLKFGQLTHFSRNRTPQPVLPEQQLRDPAVVVVRRYAVPGEERRSLSQLVLSAQFGPSVAW